MIALSVVEILRSRESSWSCFFRNIIRALHWLETTAQDDGL